MGKASPSTRDKLLAAAEKLLVERGITGLSVRKVGEEAGLNPTLVTYHFGSIGNLLDELCSQNMRPILDRWAAINPEKSGDQDFDAILRTWLEPMLMPAAYTEGGRALVVLDEIAVHGEEALQHKVLRAMEGFSQRLRTALAPHCPHLEDEELRARLRFISGSTLGPPPRSHGAPILESGRRMDDPGLLVPFARAALGN